LRLHALALHDALPIFRARRPSLWQKAAKWLRRHRPAVAAALLATFFGLVLALTVLVLSYLQIREKNVRISEKHDEVEAALEGEQDRKSTRLNSSHQII